MKIPSVVTEKHTGRTWTLVRVDRYFSRRRGVEIDLPVWQTRCWWCGDVFVIRQVLSSRGRALAPNFRRMACPSCARGRRGARRGQR